MNHSIFIYSKYDNYAIVWTKKNYENIEPDPDSAKVIN